MLPPAASDPEPRVIVFAARTGSWRSIFAVHSWIVVKPRNGQYTRYEVTGFGEPVRINRIAPDAYWFSYRPEILGDIRGESAEQAISKIQEFIRNYAYVRRGYYRIWPGRKQYIHRHRAACRTRTGNRVAADRNRERIFAPTIHSSA